MVKNLPASAVIRDNGLDPWIGYKKYKPLQYSCLENPMDKGAWRATVHRAAKESDVIEASYTAE